MRRPCTASVPVTEIALDDVAGRAGVSVQTVLRHFGSRAGLEEASFERAQQAVADERRAPVGDVPAAVRVIVDHYERRGDMALLMLAQEGHQELMARITEQGKTMHRAWVQEVFAPYVDGGRGPRRAHRPARRGHRRLHLEAAPPRPRPRPRPHRAAGCGSSWTASSHPSS